MDELLDQVVLLLIAGGSRESVVSYARTAFGLNEKQAAALHEEARRRITLAAEFDRDEQIGLAFTRLTDLYLKAVHAKDWKLAFGVQRELNKLLDLYRQALEPPPAGGESTEARAARAHFAALWPDQADEPLEELARLAIARIVELESQGKKKRRR